MTSRAFRFGVQTAGARSGEEWAARARRVEELGFSTLVMPDGLQYSPSPFAALTAAAASTTRLRVGTYVLANDYRHPVMTAKEAATVDFLSGGRFELGIGAGRPSAEKDNGMLGIPFDSGGVRLARLQESLGIIKGLLAGETVTADGPHYRATEASIGPRPVQQPLPIMVAGSGLKLLALAGREADIVAIGAMPTDSEAVVAEKIAAVRAGAGARFDQIELNLSLVAVGEQIPRWIAANLDVSKLAESASAISGTLDEMCDQLERRREALGISYITLSEELMEAFAPVVERLSGR